VRAVLVTLLLLTTTANAEPWYRGKYGSNRLLHFSIAAVGGIVAPFTARFEYGIDCRWCGGPNEVDRTMRSALMWTEANQDRAADISDLTTYVAVPTLSVALVLAGTLDTVPSTAAIIDDVVPIAETVVVTALINRGLKIGFARTRPYAHFTDERDPSEDNVSFPSAHTSQAFALATSAAMIARARNYKSEPYIWVGGMTLAATAGYLRIAADRHYFTDVLCGAALGVSAGLTVPWLMRREIEVVPTAKGVAFAGVW